VRTWREATLRPRMFSASAKMSEKRGRSCNAETRKSACLKNA
jgi:hypothetical protein